MKRLPARSLRLLLVLAVSGLALEGLFRAVLFGRAGVVQAAGRRFPTLREPGSYAHDLSPEYWLLQYRLNDHKTDGKEARFDAGLGWVNALTEPETLRHAGEDTLGDRRPVLLFGDSFAACYGGKGKTCFQDLLEASDLGARFALWNYGVGGYGFGQIALSCRRAVARSRARDPLVLVGLLVDSDLDRTLLSFRGWPMPQFRRDERGEPAAVARELTPTRDAFLERYGIPITSYALRFLKYGTRLWPRDDLRAEREAWQREVLEVNGALLRELVADLRAQGVEHAFVLFHGRSFLRPGSRYQPIEDFLVGELEALGVPYVLSWVPLREDAERTGRKEDAYWIARGPGAGHLTELGNELVFGVLRGALLGQFHGGTPVPGER